jgi:hypothetical protein
MLKIYPDIVNTISNHFSTQTTTNYKAGKITGEQLRKGGKTSLSQTNTALAVMLILRF